MKLINYLLIDKKAVRVDVSMDRAFPIIKIRYKNDSDITKVYLKYVY